MNNILKKIRLLYVEDDDTIRDVLQRVLQRKVKELFLAKNGQEGFDSFLENKPDIILTDIKMPKLSGLQMSKKIKEIDKNIPIIVVSAHSEATFFLESIEMGIDAYLLKPIDKTKLLDLLKSNAKVVLYEREKQKYNQLIQTIIDLQASIIFSADGEKKTLFANKLFFDYFKSACNDENEEEITCSYEQLNQNQNIKLLDICSDELWLDYLFKNINNNFKIQILKEDISHNFLITTKQVKYSNTDESIVIITLVEV